MTTVGVSVHDSLLVGDPAVRRSLLDRVADAGLDHVTVGDHVDFHGGTGFDGLVAATAVLATHDTLPVQVGIYQLPLRHPVLVARQLASIGEFAPGRLLLGVGVGGEDRREVRNCGVDPATRGRRADESLALLRRLAGGEPVDHEGEFFTTDRASIRPAPTPPVPLVIGGGGEPAVRRTARYGDGWWGLFCSARRYATTREQIRQAQVPDRPVPSWFGLTVWCGLDESPGAAADLLHARMEALYRLPPERFGRITVAGPPEHVAAWLRQYVEAGAEHLTLVPAANSAPEGIALAGRVRDLLSS